MGEIDTQPSALEIHWQTVLFALVGLSLGAMFQPSGRVCGAPSCYGVYLRASPIISVANAFTFLLRPIIIRILDHDHNTMFQAWGAAIKYRYDDEGVEKPEAMRKTMLSRWVPLGTGVVFLGIKLAATEGIMWSKIWGLMFLVSQLTLETIAMFPGESGLAFADIQQSNSQRAVEIHSSQNIFNSVDITDVPLASLEYSSAATISIQENLADEAISEGSHINMSAAPKSERWMIYIDGIALALSSLFQLGVFVWATLDLFLRVVEFEEDASQYGVVIALGVHIAIAAVLLMRPKTDSGSLQLLGLTTQFLIATSILIQLICAVLGYFIGKTALLVCFTLGTVSGFLDFLYALKRAPVNIPSSAFGQGVFFRQRPFVGFLLNFCTCILWYAFRFNSTGTVLPTWTSVFG